MLAIIFLSIADQCLTLVSFLNTELPMQPMMHGMCTKALLFVAVLLLFLSIIMDIRTYAVIPMELLFVRKGCVCIHPSSLTILMDIVLNALSVLFSFQKPMENPVIILCFSKKVAIRIPIGKLVGL